MKRGPQRKQPVVPPTKVVVDEVQQGARHGPAEDERLKRQARQHPQRDEPRVDSVEPGEIPPP